MVYRLKMLGRGRSRDRVLRGCSDGGGRTWASVQDQCPGSPTHHASCRPGAESSHHILRPWDGSSLQSPACLWTVLGPKLCYLEEPQRALPYPHHSPSVMWG